MSVNAVSPWALPEIQTAMENNLIPEYEELPDWEDDASRLDTAKTVLLLIEKLSDMTGEEILEEKEIDMPDEDTFPDCSDRSVLVCSALGIIKGNENGDFCPDDSLTRAQLAAVINRTAKLFDVDTSLYSHNFRDVKGHWVSSELGWQFRAGIMKGTGDGCFDPDTPVTYEQMTAVVNRAYDKIPLEDGEICYSDDEFYITEITDEIFERIDGKSYRENKYISVDELRYVHILHTDADGNVCQGELIVNEEIADDILDIFRELYNEKYPIESVKLVDEFDADDVKSMSANNTSAFNFRNIVNSDDISYHALGLAVDINPLYNPYIYVDVKKSIIQPLKGLKYTNRKSKSPYMIKEDDLCCKLFTEKGFTWGGSWDNPKDYQHFEWEG